MRFRSLVGWIALALAAGAAGAVASMDAREFYAQLDRPAWAPPGSLFGPVWTVLYVLMGIAAWLVWRAPPSSPYRRRGLALFVLQLILNALWTWIFFHWRSGAWAFVEILALWFFIIAVIVCFAGVRPLAAWLLAPYLAWVSLAAALTWTVWQRNPALL